uniref:Uncharacterized protein n=1 Tax=Anguilla anguilla TaxID=7936 RepID=A0A0E9PA69_ANGAN
MLANVCVDIHTQVLQYLLNEIFVHHLFLLLKIIS